MLFGKTLSLSAMLSLGMCITGNAQHGPSNGLRVDWTKVTSTSRSTPTLRVVVNPQLLRGADAARSLVQGSA